MSDHQCSELNDESQILVKVSDRVRFEIKLEYKVCTAPIVTYQKIEARQLDVDFLAGIVDPHAWTAITGPHGSRGRWEGPR